MAMQIAKAIDRLIVVGLLNLNTNGINYLTYVLSLSKDLLRTSLTTVGAA